MKHNYFEIDKQGNIKKTSHVAKVINNYFEIDSSGNLKESDENSSKHQKAKKDFILKFIDINVGYNLVTPILLGVIIGLILDNKFHSKPIFTILFIFFGMVSSIYNLFKMIK